MLVYFGWYHCAKELVRIEIEMHVELVFDIGSLIVERVYILSEESSHILISVMFIKLVICKAFFGSCKLH